MDIGHFYFLNEQYFVDFPDPDIQKNKEYINGQPHGRPCFFVFIDSSTGLYWMIPISSRVEKYRGIYNQKIQRSGKCNTIVFGEVLGHEKAFLIQNMCPVTPNYIGDQYIDRVANVPVRVSEPLEKELSEKARVILALYRKGTKRIFPDVLAIEQALLATKK